jgi:hypothetical protein
MSYEGYSQFLCKNGHYWTENCYNTEDKLEDNVCFKCASPAVWENMVNETNGTHEDDGTRIDGYVELEVEKEIRCTCGECIKEVTYKIPKEKDNG